MEKNKNKKQLDSFVAYCKLHPEERIWQALRNWAKVNFVYVQRSGERKSIEDLHDTFYWE